MRAADDSAPSAPSKIDRNNEFAPALIGVCTRSTAVLPLYDIPVAVTTRPGSKNDPLTLM